jgi:hypothetical protein
MIKWIKKQWVNPNGESVDIYVTESFKEAHIGAEARIGDWAHIGAEARIGDWARIGAEARIGDCARILPRDDAGIPTYIAPLPLSPRIYYITITKTNMCIGCEGHSIEDWKSFTDDRILKMDGKRALVFWRRYKKLLFTIIDDNKESN